MRELTGFDRVMIYRYDAEYNGEVVAEAKRDDLNSFLGLHYPASDIPAQARALYEKNWIRHHRRHRVRPVAARADRQPGDRAPDRPDPLDAAQCVADPHRVPEEHGRRRVHVDLADA